MKETTPKSFGGKAASENPGKARKRRERSMGEPQMSDDCFAPFFIADDPALDFLNSKAMSTATVFEGLASGEDLLTWLVQARLMDARQAAVIRATCSPAELVEVAVHARNLREWFRGFVLNHMGRRLTAKALDSLKPLNRILERDEKYWAIVARPHGSRNGQPARALEQRALRRWSTPNALLLPIAQAMADLVCLDDFSMINRREVDGCSLLFLDKTQDRGKALSKLNHR
jgi:predicted RNA-binding Zn ribbon-like protein